MADCEKQIKQKETEKRQWDEKVEQVWREFNDIVGGEKGEFYMQLSAIFKKKVKRKRGGAAAGKAGGREGELEELDEDEESTDDRKSGNDELSHSESDTDEDEVRLRVVVS